MAGLMTIGELALAVHQALTETSYPGQSSGRVREIPDRRTIRYYTTIGLLDKPAEMRGRTAYYGRRHLMQLVAIKRLQAQGKALVDIQTTLTGASDSMLRKWSELRDGVSNSMPQQERPSNEAVAISAPPRCDDFWTATPEAQTKAVEGILKPAATMSAVHVKITDNATLVIEGGLDSATFSKLQPVLENLKNVLTHGGRAANQDELPLD